MDHTKPVMSVDLSSFGIVGYVVFHTELEALVVTSAKQARRMIGKCAPIPGKNKGEKGPAVAFRVPWKSLVQYMPIYPE